MTPPPATTDPRLVTFGPGEQEALVAHLHGLGIRAGYTSPIERALESLQSAISNPAVSTLREIRDHAQQTLDMLGAT
jgi:hypothetical protein